MKKIHYKIQLVITLFLLGLSLPFLVQAESSELSSGTEYNTALKCVPSLADELGTKEFCLQVWRECVSYPADGFGNTSLHMAVKWNSVKFAVERLSCGADPNRQDDYGWTPLHEAAASGNVVMSELLLDAGADPYMTTYSLFNKESPRDVAQSNVLQLFDERGIRDLSYIEKWFH